MIQAVDIAEIIRKNPLVNPSELAEVESLLKDLSKLGIQPKKYGLKRPFSQQRKPARSRWRKIVYLNKL